MSRRETYCCRSCLAFLLKFLNFLQTFVGVSIIIYSIWMLNQWHAHSPVPPAAPSPQNSHNSHNSRPLLLRSALIGTGVGVARVPESVFPMKFGTQMVSGLEDGLDFNLDKLPSPWFIYSFMGIGIVLCLVTCIGHIAAEAVNGCCLCFYTLLITILVLLEAALVCYLIFNKHWMEDFPYDPTGELDNFRSFIDHNIDVCKWVGLAVVIIQGLSLLLSLILRAMVSTRRADYDSDDEYDATRGGIRQPLLNPQPGQTSTSTLVDSKGMHSDTWSTRMREKYGLNPADFMHNHTVDPNTTSEERGRCCIL